MKLPIEIDRRQRVIAVLALCAIDLPQPMGDFSEHMLAAAKLCPGIKADEIPMQGQRNRRLCLKRAQTLIEEMLEEIDATTT